MSDFKTDSGFVPRRLPEAVAIPADAEVSKPGASELPVNSFADYKSWCDKVRKDWDVN